MKKPVLTDKQTSEKVIACLADNLPVHTREACEQRTIYEILIRAAGMRDSAENTCKTLRDVPCGNYIRCHPEKYDDMKKSEITRTKPFIPVSCPVFKHILSRTLFVQKVGHTR